MDDVAFDLILNAVRIDDQTAVVRECNFFDGDVAGRLIDLDVGDRGGIAAGAAGHGYTSTARRGSI